MHLHVLVRGYDLRATALNINTFIRCENALIGFLPQSGIAGDADALVRGQFGTN